jgi:hypothetical protein
MYYTVTTRGERFVTQRTRAVVSCSYSIVAEIVPLSSGKLLFSSISFRKAFWE